MAYFSLVYFCYDQTLANVSLIFLFFYMQLLYHIKSCVSTPKPFVVRVLGDFKNLCKCFRQSLQNVNPEKVFFILPLSPKGSRSTFKNGVLNLNVLMLLNTLIPPKNKMLLFDLLGISDLICKI